MKTIPQHNILIIEGSDLVEPFKIKRSDGSYIDFSGYSAVGHVRKDFLDSSPLIAPFSFEIVGDTLTATIPYSETYSLISTESDTMRPVPIGYYDIFLITPENKRQYFIGGRVNYSQTITRE